MRRLKRWWWLIPLIVMLLVGGFVAWANTPTGALMAEAVAALQSDDQVIVSTDKWLVFQPAKPTATTGLIIYPGGKVQPQAYAPSAHAIAEAGYFVVIVPMPLNLAVFDAGRASEVIATYPQIKHWAIGGHSLGGAMAARFAHNNPTLVQGLVLWASYPEASADLSQRTDLAVASVYGTLDGLAKAGDIDDSRQYLPASAQFVAIEGGNHAYFGWYGAQPGDNAATITREEQHQQVVAATLKVLEHIAQP